MLSLLINATYQLKTPIEAKNLAEFLAPAYPKPELAALGITELLLNAIEHGNLELTQFKKTCQNPAQVQAEINKRLELAYYKERFVTIYWQKHATKLSLVIRDMGSGFSYHSKNSIISGSYNVQGLSDDQASNDAPGSADVPRHNCNQIAKSSPEYRQDKHGRGIMLAQTLVFTELYYNQTGNEVTAIYAI